MSFDLGVWYSETPMSLDQAESYYEHINSDWVDLRRRAEFDAFLLALQARFPDLRSPDDPPIDPDEPPISLMMSVAEMKSAPQAGPERPEEMRKKRPVPDDSPWAATLDPQGSGIALSITWDKVETVAPVVVDLAARANLLVYDPQNSHVFVPPALAGKEAAAMAPPRMTLQVAGNAPNVQAKILLEDRVLLDAPVASRREAHRHARALALENGLDHYAVKDPHSLSQSISFEPVSPDNPLLGMPMPPGTQLFDMKLRGEDDE
jgi:hypothetical protein